MQQERAIGAGAQSGSVFASAQALPAASGAPVAATLTSASISGSGGGSISGSSSSMSSISSSSSIGGFQPSVVNANVASAPSNSLPSPSLSGGSGTPGNIGAAVSKATAGLQEGSSLGAAPRQPSRRKVDDRTGPVGRRDKQQASALRQQEKGPAGELRKDKDKDIKENIQPVPATDSKPSAPTDDEINAFRDRRPDTLADMNTLED
jgi:hypothetical protein